MPLLVIQWVILIASNFGIIFSFVLWLNNSLLCGRICTMILLSPRLLSTVRQLLSVSVSALCSVSVCILRIRNLVHFCWWVILMSHIESNSQVILASGVRGYSDYFLRISLWGFFSRVFFFIRKVSLYKNLSYPYKDIVPRAPLDRSKGSFQRGPWSIVEVRQK